MPRLFLILASALIFARPSLCSPDGFLSMVQWPKSMYVPESSPGIRLDEAADVLSSVLGLSAKAVDGWGGKVDILSRPEAALLMDATYDSALSAEDMKSGGVNFDLVQEQSLPADTLRRAVHAVTADIETHFPQATVVSIADNAITSMNAAGLEDVHVGEKWNKMEGISEGVSQILASMEKLRLWLVESGSLAVNGVPDMYSISVPGAINAQEAKALRAQFEQLSKTLGTVYGGNFVSCIVAESHDVGVKKRAKRDAAKEKAGKTPAKEETITEKDFRSPDTPAMFGIILVVSISIALLVFFVATGMWFMEPGKDTIIYRMSMTRTKRD